MTLYIILVKLNEIHGDVVASCDPEPQLDRYHSIDQVSSWTDEKGIKFAEESATCQPNFEDEEAVHYSSKCA